MSKSTTQDFLRGDRRMQSRILVITGATALAAIVLVAGCARWVYPRLTSPSGIHVQAMVAAVGPGIEPGSKVLLHGAEIGEVTELAPSASGGVNLDMRLTDSADLGTDFQIDFRPQNYFGISAVNLSNGTETKPRVVDGDSFDRGAVNDFTMSTMLEQGSLVVDGSLTSTVIESLDKVTRYANGLAPLVESGVLLAENVSKTQAQLPSAFLGRMNDLLTELPAFNKEVTSALHSMYLSLYNRLPNGEFGINEPLLDDTDETLALLGSDLFGLAGTLLSSHESSLTPLTQVAKAQLDPLPGLFTGSNPFDTAVSAIDRLESAFGGTDAQRTLQVRLMLDQLPAISGVLASTGTLPGNGGVR